MTSYPETVLTLARQPSGFVPVVMSVTALAVVLGSIATGGAVRQADEGISAHIFQLLIAAELPLLVVFLVKWLRKDARAALTILAVQTAAICIALFPVWYFGL